MLSIFVWTLVALGAAVLVLVVASVTNGRDGGLRSFLRDLRAGLREWRSRGIAAPVTAIEPEPVDATFDEFFAAAQVDDEAYLRVDDLTDTLAWARARASQASRSVGIGRR